MNTPQRIHLCLAHMSGNEQKYIDEAFADNWVVPLGPNVDAFEHELHDFLSHDDSSRSHLRVAAVSAGTAAIHLGLILAGVKPGDEVFMSVMGTDGETIVQQTSYAPTVFYTVGPVHKGFEASMAGSVNGGHAAEYLKTAHILIYTVGK